MHNCTMSTARLNVGESCTPQLNTICKKCKAKVLNGVHCARCSEYYHPSCAKLLTKIKFLSTDSVMCRKTTDI